jgi:hypothetical protein
MSITFALPNYSFGTSAGNAVVQDPQNWNRSNTFSGPSPFEIPEFVNLTLESPTKLSVEFRYPNQEQAEGMDRQASNDGSVSVRLAAKTKKILKIEYRGDIEKFLASSFQIDERVFGSFGEPSSQTLNSFRQNLSLIKNILGSMPQEVAGQLRSAVKAGAPQP